jgi:hypothetical protein
MSYNESIKSISLVADSSLGIFTGVSGIGVGGGPSSVSNAGKIYRFVKVTGTKQAGLCTAGTDTAVGVVQNKPQQTGAAATVAINGVSDVISGAGAGADAILAGSKVTSDDEGRAVLAEEGDVVHGIALAPSAAAGELIPVLLTV